MERIIIDGIEVVRGGMIILPAEITEKLEAVDSVETIPDEVNVEMSKDKIIKMFSKPVYRIPFRYHVVKWIEQSYNEFMQKQNDATVIERIIENKKHFIDTLNNSYNEIRLMENICRYVILREWIAVSGVDDKNVTKEIIEKEIVIDVITAMSEIHGKTRFNISECYYKDRK